MLNYEYTIIYATGLAPVFLISALYGNEWSASQQGCFILAKEPLGKHMKGGCTDPGAGLDFVDE
jgi:hypothetical protein